MRYLKYLFLFLIIGILSSIFLNASLQQRVGDLLCDSCILVSFIQIASAQEAPQAPKTFEEAKTIGERIFIGFPEVLKGIWQEALAIWGKMAGWFKNLWDSYIFPWLQNIWQRICSFLEKEVEKRKPEIEKEFEREKEEMREEIKKEMSETGKSLWQRIKELISG